MKNMSKKTKIIIISAVSAVVVIAIVLIVLLGGGDGGGTVQPCDIHFDENGDDVCDACGFQFAAEPAEPVYDYKADRKKAVEALNGFFKSELSISSLMNQRAVMSDIKLEQEVRNSIDKVSDPGVSQILFSNNVAYVSYNKTQGTKRIVDEYFVLKDDGYYVIQNREGGGYEYVFNQFVLPNLSDLKIEASDISYADVSKVFRISPTYLKRFAVQLLCETKLLDNFTEKTFSKADDLEDFINKVDMTAYFRIDEETGELVELNFTSKLNQNGLSSDLIYFSMIRKGNDIEVLLKNYFQTNEEHKLLITQTSDNRYRIAYDKIKYNLIGGKSSHIRFNANVKIVEDIPFYLQPEIEEQMLHGDRIIQVYNNIKSQYSRKFTVSDARETCSPIYIYNSQYLFYARMVKNEDGKFVFDGLQMSIVEHDVCMAEFGNRSDLIKIISHKASELWMDNIVEKYASGIHIEGVSHNGCEHVRFFDPEYNTLVVCVRRGDRYYLVDYNTELGLNNKFVCRAEYLPEYGVVSLTEHSEYELLVNVWMSDGLTVAGGGAVSCHRVAVYEPALEAYIIFAINGEKAYFEKIQPYAPGLCTGEIKIESNRLIIRDHAH